MFKRISLICGALLIGLTLSNFASAQSKIGQNYYHNSNNNSNQGYYNQNGYNNQNSSLTGSLPQILQIAGLLMNVLNFNTDLSTLTNILGAFIAPSNNQRGFNIMDMIGLKSSLGQYLGTGQQKQLNRILRAYR